MGNEKYLLKIIDLQEQIIETQRLMMNGEGNDILQNNELITENKGFDKEGFRRYLESEEVSQQTLNTYLRQVGLFFNDYNVLSLDTLREYEKDIKSSTKFKPKTINIKISAMSKYFKFVGFEGYKFKKMKLGKNSFCDNAIDEEQFKKFVDYVRDKNTTAFKIAMIIGYTGVRVSELINLKSADLKKGHSDIVGKGNKQRRIYYPDILQKELQGICDDEYMVVNRYGQKLTSRGVSGLLRAWGKRAEIPWEVMHPHSFRHYFAKSFLSKNNDITLLGDLLGHSDISTTAIYTRMTTKEQRQKIDEVFGGVTCEQV